MLEVKRLTVERTSLIREDTVNLPQHSHFYQAFSPSLATAGKHFFFIVPAVKAFGTKRQEAQADKSLRLNAELLERKRKDLLTNILVTTTLALLLSVTRICPLVPRLRIDVAIRGSWLLTL